MKVREEEDVEGVLDEALPVTIKALGLADVVYFCPNPECPEPRFALGAMWRV
jgi:hypothetical protein